MHSVVEGSLQAASAAVRLLRGETPADVQVPPTGFAPPKFDWREMQRWGISESALPPGSEIHFRSPTVWEQYRFQVLGILVTLLLQAALISWLIFEHKRRHRAEVLARNSMAELTHMNRIATASQLSASIAHEVNQPLTGIVTRANAALRWLAAGTPNVDKAQAALTEIVNAGHRASDIIASVRSMFTKDTRAKSQVDINELIWTVLGLVYIDLRKHQIELETGLDEQLPPVFGNRVQLQQVILNLITNAIDAMKSVEPRVPRVLTVRTRLVESDGVHVSVEDTGIGVDPSTIGRIFKPLFTTKEHGMGMGLSICQSIIEGHDGRIWATAAKEHGAIFEFVLPKLCN
jgi:C4-dicarboxylate-specific signal transduction histidine kinase